MMGRQRRDQVKLFYEFRLDDRIPKNHLLRRIDVFVAAVQGREPPLLWSVEFMKKVVHVASTTLRRLCSL